MKLIDSIDVLRPSTGIVWPGTAEVAALVT
jgi:hypothetical protein